jgi:hypothetical protein
VGFRTEETWGQGCCFRKEEIIKYIRNGSCGKKTNGETILPDVYI